MGKIGAAVAAVLATMGLATSTASATPTTLGPTNFGSYTWSLGTSGQTAINLTADGITSYAAPADGTVSSYTYQPYMCSTCGSRLVVMRLVMSSSDVRGGGLRDDVFVGRELGEMDSATDRRGEAAACGLAVGP